MSRAGLIRKCFEAYRDCQTELAELQKEREYIQYLRNNVRGVSYEPRVPNSSAPSGSSKALIYDKRMKEIASQMFMLSSVVNYCDQLLTALETDAESLMRERYVVGMSIDTIATARNLNREQVKYRIEQIIRGM